MSELSLLLRRNRFALEIMVILFLCEFSLMLALNYMMLNISALHTDLLDAFILLLISAPLILWRSRAVHGRESQNLSRAVQSSSHAVVLLDTRGRIYWVNEGFTRISGYTMEEVLGADASALLSSGMSEPSALAQMHAAKSGSQACRVEVCNRRKDGSLYWGDLDVRPDFDARGKLVGFIEICTDITELKESRSRLKASLLEAEALRQTVDTHAIVSVADRDGRITDANVAFCNISGYSREQLIGSNHRLLNSGNHDAAFWSAMWDDIASGRPWRGEICNRNCRGQLYWVDSMIAPFKGVDGLVDKYVSVRVDITARKRLEQEREQQTLLLQDAQERVRMATESAGIGIWSFNLITGAQKWDAQQYRLFGLSYDPNCRVPIYDLWHSHLHPEDAEQAVAAFSQTIASGVPFVNQFRIIRPDGAVRLIKALGSPRLDTQGRVEYIVGTNMDVTDAALLSRSMDEARQRAEEASRVKTQFMANMSHEIRTPLNGVLGLLRLLEYTPLDTRQRDYVQQAERVSGLMLRMVDSILDYTSLEVQRMVLHCYPFAVDNWLEEVAVVIAASVGESEINVLFDVPQSLPLSLVGDGKRLQQVLFCLLDNAIKFTAAGVVVCQIELQQQTPSHCRLAFCVRDTGIGIAAQSLEAIFGEFVQLESGDTRAYGGVGLGLPVAQRLVHLMGGSLAVQSQLGQGSSFSFTLELALPELDAQVPAASQRALLLPKAEAAALVVDACPSARQLLARLAESQVGPASTADSCTQALALVRSRLEGDGLPFTLILLDWHMPDADSWQTLQELRALYAQHSDVQPQIVMLSNNANVARHQLMVARDKLADGFLAKPFTAGMLRRLLQRSPDAPREPVAAVSRTPRLPNMRVLLVEDNPINQRVMQQMLLAEGARVTLAENGQQGVDVVRASLDVEAFDVVLMDLQMPVLDGYQAARAIRTDLAQNRLPIIAVSANLAAVDRAQSQSAGMNAHIGKPFVLEELVAEMRRLTGLELPDEQAPPEGALLHAYWIGGQAAAPDAAALLQQGVLLHLLDAEELAAVQAPEGHAALLLADLATATGARLRDWAGHHSAGTRALVVLAESVTEEQMQACIDAGAVDLVPTAYASAQLGVIARKHLDAQGALRTDPHNKVPGIDAHGAMARTQTDLSFFGSLMHAFYEELPQRRAQMQQAWSHEQDQIKLRCHSLKGLAATFGLQSLAQVALQAENQSQQAPPDAALLLQLDAEMQSAGFQILRWLTLHPNCILDIP
ncbi:PAS domain S-box protein [Rhodoferax sp.]|uniref:PAS domain S-box protein n=1 Tax=Rhodoferax sp. TaxID=50421 RepID=UPI0025CEB961|nr:PAS domain S-box protein [Rhodoferax sp.]